MVFLMNHDDLAIRNRARLLLAETSEDRNEVLEKYQAALITPGDAAKGRVVFERVCASCHQIGGQYGKSFGPDLASIRNRHAEFILSDILNPNRSIADKYEMWSLVKKNGDQMNGIIASETPSAIRILFVGGEEATLERADLQNMEASATSAMPSGLENSISVKEMADLLAFLKNIH
jgi:putative heme-binding domain-containing protein